ncbi:outer membrane protein assembly complex, YaeT protein [Anopheles sinensis]|uniref:Outer membrane protein assembly complex, YaeT protein n=1 Tax=Anopheles sinensis TaxID=74873 RepID=A0A084VKT5_ANOSI|nr:outer membrane protein assembly complex, YaeT protein [Anopheles sinensis]
MGSKASVCEARAPSQPLKNDGKARRGYDETDPGRGGAISCGNAPEHSRIGIGIADGWMGSREWRNLAASAK